MRDCEVSMVSLMKQLWHDYPIAMLEYEQWFYNFCKDGILPESKEGIKTFASLLLFSQKMQLELMEKFCRDRGYHLWVERKNGKWKYNIYQCVFRAEARKTDEDVVIVSGEHDDFDTAYRTGVEAIMCSLDQRLRNSGAYKHEAVNMHSVRKIIDGYDELMHNLTCS